MLLFTTGSQLAVEQVAQQVVAKQRKFCYDKGNIEALTVKNKKTRSKRT